MLRLSFLVFIALLISTQASADVEQCLNVEDDFERLDCYDRELGFGPQISTTQGTGDWKVRTETSQMDDSTNVFLNIQSEDHTNCRYDSAPHKLWIACRENKTTLWVWFGGCFMSGNQGKGRVTYRLDRDKASQISMRESNDNSALGLWNGGSSIPFIKKMFGKEQLLLRATPFSDSTVTGTFRIGGIEDAIEPLREACNW